MKKINSKGFTLIEALIVLLLIGIILLTLIPSVITITNKNKKKSCVSTKNSIISSAKMYVAENKYTKINCGTNNISVSELKEYGNLTDKVLDDKFLNTNVVVTYNCTTKEFTYIYNIDCES